MTDTKEMRRIVSMNAGQYKTVYEYFAQERLDGFFNGKGREIEFAGKTESSLKFTGSGIKCLSDVFGIKLKAKDPQLQNYSLFKSKYLEAAYGEGNEVNEITQLNSSSLLALMFFYSINDNKPLRLKVFVGGKEHRLKFTSTIFEKENPVYAANHPSSIDIALYGVDDDTNERVVLFLESKFGEYLTSGNCAAGKSYKDEYLKIESVRNDLSVMEGVSFSTEDTPAVMGPDHYCQGIKQMVSHHIGARNSYELNIEKRKVYLGAILFDFGGIEDSQNKLDQYRIDYNGLSKVLNCLYVDTNVNVIDGILTYQEVFTDNVSFPLDKAVRSLYL